MAKKKSLYGVIGIGRFGYSLAKTLAERGCDVIALDKDPERVKLILEYTDNAFVVNNLSRDSLIDVGINKCDCVAICIADKVDISILATLTVIDLGVKKVISKAATIDQGNVLERLGATVVYPENDMGIRLGQKLASSNILDQISLNEEINITEIKLTKKVFGQSIIDINLRKKYGLNIIAIDHEGKISTQIDPNFIFSDGDSIVVVGNVNEINSFTKFLG